MSFAQQEKANQRAWAERDPFMEARLDDRHGPKTWVLKSDLAAHNAFRPEWWTQIEARVHRWGRALNSSQAFALNLFGPALDPMVARAAWRGFSERRLPADAKVAVRFEFDYSMDAGERYSGVQLGERRQRTQIDVLFEVDSPSERGALLIEVKYTEHEFGTCRGGTKGDPGCDDLVRLMRDSQRCWLTRHEGRKYWSLMTQESSSFRFPQMAASQCPFRDDLYQLMRNRVLADSMREVAHLDWADTAVCIHPENSDLRALFKGDAANRGFGDAFAALSQRKVQSLEPVSIVEALSASSPALGNWRRYMMERYRI